MYVECAFVDGSASTLFFISYKWSAVACAGSLHNFLCSQRSPVCPDGYKWIPETGNSCFKITDAGPLASQFMYNGINYTIADE